MLDLFVRAELNLRHVLDLHLFELKGEVCFLIYELG